MSGWLKLRNTISVSCVHLPLPCIFIVILKKSQFNFYLLKCFLLAWRLRINFKYHLSLCITLACHIKAIFLPCLRRSCWSQVRRRDTLSTKTLKNKNKQTNKNSIYVMSLIAKVLLEPCYRRNREGFHVTSFLGNGLQNPCHLEK